MESLPRRSILMAGGIELRADAERDALVAELQTCPKTIPENPKIAGVELASKERLVHSSSAVAVMSGVDPQSLVDLRFFDGSHSGPQPRSARFPRTWSVACVPMRIRQDDAGSSRRKKSVRYPRQLQGDGTALGRIAS
jgi:hypothetical protein